MQTTLETSYKRLDRPGLRPSYGVSKEFKIGALKSFCEDLTKDQALQEKLRKIFSQMELDDILYMSGEISKLKENMNITNKMKESDKVLFILSYLVESVKSKNYRKYLNSFYQNIKELIYRF
jgi:hypothetical protein